MALNPAVLTGLIGAGVSALSVGGNLATSALNSSRAWKYTQRAMTYQDQLNRAYTRDSYGLMREGLRNAGYNPLLALGSSANSAVYSGSSINSDSDNGSQAVQSAIDAMRLRNENKLVKTQAKVNESQSDLNTQLTYKALADEINSRSSSAVQNATEQKILNDIYWDNETNREIIKRIRAETKFTNERARGFSASSSQSKNYGIGANGSAGKGKFKVGSVGIDANYGSSKSSSKSW